MAYVLVRHKISDYAKWKPIFDEHGAARKASGSKGGRLFRSSDNSNELIVLFEWDDAKKAREFVQSANLREIMMKAGVVDKPDTFFLEEIEKLSN